MKIKPKNNVYVCQISSNQLKIIKCVSGRGLKREFFASQVELVPAQPEGIIQAFKEAGYNYEPIILSLPASSATCRYLKIPSILPQEIEKITSLQASRYLPYPNSELITAYQVVQTEKTGYAYVNFIIAQRIQIERYLNIFKEFKPAKLDIVMNAYGLANLYRAFKPRDTASIAILDIGAEAAEIAAVHNHKLNFSRSFNLEQKSPNWENLLLEEINKTREVYAQEVSKEGINKIIIIGLGGVYQGAERAILNKQADFEVEVMSCVSKLNFSRESLEVISSCTSSFAGLIGLALEGVEETLMLLPKDIKEERKKSALSKRYLRRGALIAGAIIILALSLFKNLDNKSKYLRQLKLETDKLAETALPLEAMEKRMRALEKRLRKSPSSLDILSQLHQVMPAEVSLINFTYNEDDEVILRGQAQSLESVFEFVSQIKKSDVFMAFSVKLRYATKRSSSGLELIDFEIACSRRN